MTDRRGGWPGPRRVFVGVRLDPTQVEAVDRIRAQETTRTGKDPGQSGVIRMLLDHAIPAYLTDPPPAPEETP